MTAQKRSTLLILAAAVTGALLSSCAYEYYDHESSGSVAYSSHRPASTSVFIRTSSSRWGYDPTCRSYYDYSRRCYYDPYLNGYYPRGYRPQVVVGAPHPHGWHRGRSTCPPPRNVINRNLNNYRNRHQQYCNLNHSWARNLRNHTPSHSNSIWNRGDHRHQGNNGWNRGNNGWNRGNNGSVCNNNGWNRGNNGGANRHGNPGSSNRHGNPGGSNRQGNPGGANRHNSAGNTNAIHKKNLNGPTNRPSDNKRIRNYAAASQKAAQAKNAAAQRQAQRGNRIR